MISELDPIFLQVISRRDIHAGIGHMGTVGINPEIFGGSWVLGEGQKGSPKQRGNQQNRRGEELLRHGDLSYLPFFNGLGPSLVMEPKRTLSLGGCRYYL